MISEVYCTKRAKTHENRKWKQALKNMFGLKEDSLESMGGYQCVLPFLPTGIKKSRLCPGHINHPELPTEGCAADKKLAGEQIYAEERQIIILLLESTSSSRNSPGWVLLLQLSTVQ